MRGIASNTRDVNHHHLFEGFVRNSNDSVSAEDRGEDRPGNYEGSEGPPAEVMAGQYVGLAVLLHPRHPAVGVHRDQDEQDEVNRHRDVQTESVLLRHHVDGRVSDINWLSSLFCTYYATLRGSASPRDYCKTTGGRRRNNFLPFFCYFMFPDAGSSSGPSAADTMNSTFLPFGLGYEAWILLLIRVVVPTARRRLAVRPL